MSTAGLLISAAAFLLVVSALALGAYLFIPMPPRPTEQIDKEWSERPSGSVQFFGKNSTPSAQAWLDARDRREWMQMIAIIISIASIVLAILLGATLAIGGSYFAGRGDAAESAKAWVAKWRPGASIECQARDTDGNGYVSCTVGGDGAPIEAIECGVNRWYHGFQTRGCRLMKGYAGSQR